MVGGRGRSGAFGGASASVRTNPQGHESILRGGKRIHIRLATQDARQRLQLLNVTGCELGFELCGNARPCSEPNGPKPLAKSGRSVMIGRPCKTCLHSGPLQGNRMARLSAAFALIVLLVHSGMLPAHPGHELAKGLRTWKELKGIAEVEASF